MIIFEVQSGKMRNGFYDRSTATVISYLVANAPNGNEPFIIIIMNKLRVWGFFLYAIDSNLV